MNGEKTGDAGPQRVRVRGPQTAPTLAEVVGDPRRGHVHERTAAQRSQVLRRRQLRLNLLVTLILATLLVGLGIAAQGEGMALTVAVYPVMMVAACWALLRARKIELP